jgi:spore germination protein KC
MENKIKNMYINIQNPYDKSKLITIEVEYITSKKKVQFKYEAVTFLIEVYVTGSVTELHGYAVPGKEENRELWEDGLSKAIEDKIRNIMNAAQKEYNADIFGFSEIIYRWHFKHWEQYCDELDELFPEIPVNISVIANIKDFGVITNRIAS